MLEVFLVGIFGTLFGIYKWRDNTRANRNSSLASVSVVDVLPNAIASIKNTSTAYGSELRVRIYKPKNFENKHNGEFWRYVADSEKSYCDKLEVIVSRVKSNSIEWDSKLVLDNDLSIGEVSIFHLKDAQEPKDKKGKKYPLVHFSLIKVEVTMDEYSGVLKEKFMVFRLARESLRYGGKDDFIKNRLHPYGIWVPVYSWSKWKN